MESSQLCEGFKYIVPFNCFGLFSADKKQPPSESWWTRPELQHDRAAFEKRLVDEELRMVGSRFGGKGKPFNNDEIREHKRKK